MHDYNPILQAVLFHVILKNMTTSSMLTQSLQCPTPAEQLLAMSNNLFLKSVGNYFIILSFPGQREIICLYTPF